MFCKNCGSEISNNAKFCFKCGNEIEGTPKLNKKVVEDNEIKFKFKPEFEMLYKLLVNMQYGIASMFLVMYSGYMFQVTTASVSEQTEKMFGVAMIIGIITVLIKMIFEKKQYDVLEYRFYNTKLSYIDGFLNKEEKEIKYKYIREITMTQSVLERFCGLGTINLYTNASSIGYNSGNHHSMQGKNGICIHCVGNVEEKYKIIKKIIDEGTPEEY